MQHLYQYRALINRVIDGDTVEATVDLGFHITQVQRLRLMGIDTPERGQPGWSESTAALHNRIYFEEVTIHTYKMDSFGRYMADIFLRDENINTWMLTEGFAKVYVKGI